MKSTILVPVLAGFLSVLSAKAAGERFLRVDDLKLVFAKNSDGESALELVGGTYRDTAGATDERITTYLKEGTLVYFPAKCFDVALGVFRQPLGAKKRKALRIDLAGVAKEDDGLKLASVDDAPGVRASFVRIRDCARIRAE